MGFDPATGQWLTDAEEAQRIRNAALGGAQTDDSDLDARTQQLMRAAGYGSPMPTPQPPQSPNLRIGPLDISGNRLDSSALAVLQALQGMPRGRGFGGNFVQGLAGGLAGGRVRSAGLRQQQFEAEQERAKEYNEAAQRFRGQAALAAASSRGERRYPLTPSLRRQLKAANVFVPEEAADVPENVAFRDLPIRPERDPGLAMLTKLSIEDKINKMQQEDTDAESFADEVASFRTDPKIPARLLAKAPQIVGMINKRLKESGSKFTHSQLLGMYAGREQLQRTQNAQRFTQLRQSAQTVAKHIKQLEDFYKDYGDEFEKKKKEGGAARFLNPGELRIYNKGVLSAASNGFLGPDAAERANELMGTVNAVSREAAMVFSGGFAPFEKDLQEAHQTISASVGPRAHKGQMTALKALLKARIGIAQKALPFSGGKDNPYLLDVSPIEGWDEGEKEAEAGRPIKRPDVSASTPDSGNSAGKQFLQNWKTKKPRGSKP